MQNNTFKLKVFDPKKRLGENEKLLKIFFKKLKNVNGLEQFSVQIQIILILNYEKVY